MVCQDEKDSKNLRHERNAQDQNHRQEKYTLCSKLARATVETEAPIHRQYVVCLSRSIESVCNNGFACWR